MAVSNTLRPYDWLLKRRVPFSILNILRTIGIYKSMIFRAINHRYISENSDKLPKRMTIFFFTVIIWWLSNRYLRPLLGANIQNIRNVFGNGPFVQNVFSQSLPVDLVCLTLFAIFWKAKIIPAPQINVKLIRISKEGTIWGLLICVPTIPLALHLGYHLGFKPNWQSILGNIISNSYEEFTYRVFLFSIAAYAFRNIWLGIFISAILFAAVHTQYPISMQIIVGLAGFCFSLAYVRTGTILSGLFAHQLSDMILDSILVQ